MKDKKILIADDHPIFRRGLTEIISESFPECRVMEADSGTSAYNTIVNEKPDYCILDINMPNMSGVEACKKVLFEKIKTKIIFLSMHSEREMIRMALLSGGSAYILKDNSINEVVDCIKKIDENEGYISPSLANIVKGIKDDENRKQNVVDLINNLSKSEIKVLKLVVQNYTTKEIADILFLSDKTIENCRSRICQKLKLPPRNNSLLLWISENKELLSTLNNL
jgi:DNA-binding NarL/FixJ family response regulator